MKGGGCPTFFGCCKINGYQDENKTAKDKKYPKGFGSPWGVVFKIVFSYAIG